VKESYDPDCWVCMGPTLLTMCAIEIAQTQYISKIPAHADFDVINVEVVMTHIRAGKKKYPLFPLHPRSFRSWQRFFSRSVAVHIFSHTSSKLKNVDDPRYSAYALLGPQYCPIAYFSTKNF